MVVIIVCLVFIHALPITTLDIIKKQPGQNQRLFVSISNANKVQRLPLMKRGK